MWEDNDLVELRKDLVNFATRFGVTRHDAEDAAQRVLERLLSQYLGFRSLLDGTMIGNKRYARQMCLNVIRDEQRSRSRRRYREAAWCEDRVCPKAPDVLAIEVEHTTQLFAAVSTMEKRLPAPVVQAFVLCDLEGLSPTGAAMVLGIPVGTAKTRVRRARAFLKKAVVQFTGQALGEKDETSNAAGAPSMGAFVRSSHFITRYGRLRRRLCDVAVDARMRNARDRH